MDHDTLRSLFEDIHRIRSRPSQFFDYPAVTTTDSGNSQVWLDTAQIEPDVAESDERVKPAFKSVTWDDIGGHDDAKRQMREAIELPITHKDIFAFYGIRPPKGILLYGPPGCGKTMFGKAAASSIAKLHNCSMDDGGFMYVKGPELQDKYVGESERKVRELFEEAKDYKEENGFPAIIFIDEADAVLMNRTTGSRHDNSLVASFLTEMDGLEESSAIVILATNRPGDIDPAVVRDGRIDRKIKIGRPGLKESQSILRMNLTGVPVIGTTHDRLANLMAKELFAPTRILLRLHTTNGSHDLTLSHVINGAMLAGVVAQAASIALHRDLEANTQTGLRKADVIKAIDSVQSQQVDLDHSDSLRDLFEFGDAKPVRVEKCPPPERTVRNTRKRISEGPKNIFDEAA